MSERRRTGWRSTAVCVLVAAATMTASGAEGRQARGELFLRNGDLVTANGRSDSLIRFRPGPGKFRATRLPLGVRLKPKGLSYSKFCEKLAVANTFDVVVFDVWTHEVEVIESAKFGLVADVQWDMACNLLIADMGRESVSSWPRDGQVWLYTPGGDLVPVGGGYNWVNPAFLDMDEWGTLFVVDKGAGPPIPGNTDWKYDAILKTGAPGYRFPKFRFRRAGLQATALMVHPDGRLFVGNGDELALIEDSRLRSLCAPGDFTRVNGIALDPDLRIFVVDGFDVFGTSRLVQLRGGCDLSTVASGSKINGSQGLAVGLPSR